MSTQRPSSLAGLLVGCFALASSAAAAPQGLFPRSLDLHEQEPLPYRCAIGDFTGDGIGDALLFQLFNLPGQIVPSLGGGEFGVPVAVTPVIALPQHLAVEDFNGDGLADFVLVKGANPGSPIVLYLNEGDLSFREVQVGALVEEVEELRIGDVNGDGMKDVFVSSLGVFSNGIRVDAGIFVFAFDGAEFSSAPLVATMEAVDDFNALDLTGDGRTDIIRPTFPVSTWRLSASLAAGGFSTPRTIFPAALDSAEEIEFGDLDGDGDLDLVAIRFGAPTDAFIMERNSLGNFEARVALNSGLSVARSVEVRDVDGDGIGDILFGALDRQSDFLSVRRGIGDFSYAQTKPLLSDNIFALGDLTGDGALDGLADGDALPGSSVSYLTRVGEPGGPYFNVAGPLYSRLGSTASFTALDVDGDGDDDFISAGPGGQNDLEFFWCQNAGGLQFERPASLANSAGPARRVVGALDLNGDSRRDLLVMTFPPNRLDVQLYRGPFDFAPPVGISSLGAGQIEELAAADFDGDAVPDFISQLSGAPGIRVFAHRGGGGGTTFVRTQVIPVQRGVQAALYFDVNGDGLTDMVTLSPQAASVILCDGAGGFADPVDFQTMGVPGDFGGALDVDRDGDLDVLGRSSGGPWMWAENQSLGAFGAFQPLNVMGIESATAIGSEDLNGDGLADLVAFGAEDESNRDVILIAQAAGGFAGPERIGTSFFITGKTQFVDLDADGDLNAWSGSTQQVVVHGNENVPAAGSDAQVCDSAQANSTGAFGALRAFGSTSVGSDNLSLRAIRLPANQFGFFVGSSTIGVPVLVPGSEGALCLTGAVGRYDEPTEVQSSGPGGTFAIPVNPALLQTANGPVAALAGQTWYFQAWHRDQQLGGASTSNFTSAIELTFAP